jgi:hypothetical protein
MKSSICVIGGNNKSSNDAGQRNNNDSYRNNEGNMAREDRILRVPYYDRGHTVEYNPNVGSPSNYNGKITSGYKSSLRSPLDYNKETYGTDPTLRGPSDYNRGPTSGNDRTLRGTPNYNGRQPAGNDQSLRGTPNYNRGATAGNDQTLRGPSNYNRGATAGNDQTLRGPRNYNGRQPAGNDQSLRGPRNYNGRQPAGNDQSLRGPTEANDQSLRGPSNYNGRQPVGNDQTLRGPTNYNRGKTVENDQSLRGPTEGNDQTLRDPPNYNGRQPAGNDQSLRGPTNYNRGKTGENKQTLRDPAKYNGRQPAGNDQTLRCPPNYNGRQPEDDQSLRGPTNYNRGNSDGNDESFRSPSNYNRGQTPRNDQSFRNTPNYNRGKTSGNDRSLTGPSFNDKNNTQIRILNNVSGQQLLTFKISKIAPEDRLNKNNIYQFNNIPYQELSDHGVHNGKYKEYASVNPGSYRYDITLNNGVISSGNINLKNGSYYTIILEGLRDAENMDNSQKYPVVAVAYEDNNLCPTNGYSSLRFINASAAVPANGVNSVDVYIDDKLIFKNVPYQGMGKTINNAESVQLEAGKSVNVRILPGTNNNNMTLFPTLSFKPKSNGVYTLLTTGINGSRDYPLTGVAILNGCKRNQLVRLPNKTDNTAQNSNRNQPRLNDDNDTINSNKNNSHGRNKQQKNYSTNLDSNDNKWKKVGKNLSIGY